MSSNLRAVDLFAGWGGFTEGATQAGAEVLVAANHWPLAVEAHAKNHPSTRHVCQDLRQYDFSTLPAYDVLLASPACQGHSQAAQPARKRSASARRTHDALRATAWAVVDCLEATRPRYALIENVVDFARWPLFGNWRECLHALGYQTRLDVLCASRHGTPQRRRRLFVVAARDAELPAELSPAEEETPIGPHLDFEADARWRPVSLASENVQRRIERAQSNHGDRCLTQHVTGHPGVPLDEPVRTITTKDQWAIVDGDRYRPLTVRETARAMGFPDSYRWPSEVGRRDTIRGLGNAVCPPVARELVASIARAAGVPNVGRAA